MLYERWRQIARNFSGEIALRDLPSNRRWTFGELETLAHVPCDSVETVAFPTGTSADFVIEVLRAWRYGNMVCPVETDQPQPKITPGLPPEVVHLKMTSGTTSAPRFVAFTASQLMA